jgi:hypothetical protein
MKTFRQAVLDRDIDAVEALLADDVTFVSPAVFKPYHGRAITSAILRGVLRVVEDFAYVREIGSPDGRDHALVFVAHVDGREVNGCDFLHYDDQGRIDHLMVMVRPLSGLNALAQAMAAQFDRITAEAAALLEE